MKTGKALSCALLIVLITAGVSFGGDAETSSINRMRKIIELRDRVRQNKPRDHKHNGPADYTYYETIVQQIRKNWDWTNAENRKEKDLYLIAYVSIAADGTLTLLHIEKSSGNVAFDQSAIDALKKSSPLIKPPGKMEIGIRFAP